MAYTNKLHVIYGDATLGLGGNNFHYIFSYERGGLESLKVNGKEWLYREPMPTFWRATTDNDRGSGFNIKSAQWLAADTFHKCIGIDLTIDDKHFEQLPIAPVSNHFSNQEMAETVVIKYSYETLTVPSTLVTVTYTVSSDGQIKVEMHYRGNDKLPELPVVGMRFIMPTVATGFDYTGLSGETYPDRMAGAVKGHFHVDGLPVTKYLVPQEMGMHMDTETVKVTRNTTLNNADPSQESFTLEFKQATDGQPFAFSCLPYTAEELENATHLEELPLARRTVLVIAGAVRGVGGIDSWGADVEDKYHLPAGKDVDFAFVIKPY